MFPRSRFGLGSQGESEFQHYVNNPLAPAATSEWMKMTLRKLPPTYPPAAFFIACLMIASGGQVSTAQAQITDKTAVPATGNRVATLEEQLINQLRATTEDRKAYIRLVVQLVNSGQFEQRYLLAIERYAIRKNSQFPFPYFERAMRFEADKRGIELLPVQLLAGSKSTYTP